MFRKVLYATAAVATLLVPLGLTSQADAGVHVELVRYHRAHYDVLYRSCNREPWLLYRTTYSRHYAHELAESLHCRGLETSIVRCF
jgi:hypothetical protein